MFISSVFILFNIISLFIIGGFKKNIFLRLFICLLTFIPLLYLSAHYVINKFTGDGINGVIYFYFFKKGFPWESINDYFPIIALIVFINIVLFAGLFVLSKNRINKKITYKNIIWMFFCFFFSVYTNPSSKNIVRLYQENNINETPTQKAKYLSDFLSYFATNDEINNPVVKKNLIYIYLESFDYSFIDKDIFKKSTPNLRLLANSGLLFNNVTQLAGAYHTEAGMAASQCSLPFELIKKPTPENPVVCLGDILKSIGYNNIYYSGADKYFGDKFGFYTNHGFTEIQDKYSLSDVNQIKDLTSWGLYDQDLFMLLSNRLLGKDNNLPEFKQPFSLFTINLDTHTPVLYSKRCLHLFPDSDRNNWFGAISCTDFLIGEFIHKIQQSPLWDNTYIVLSSDHLPPATREIADIVNAIPNRKLVFFCFGQRYKAFYHR